MIRVTDIGGVSISPYDKASTVFFVPFEDEVAIRISGTDEDNGCSCAAVSTIACAETLGIKLDVVARSAVILRKVEVSCS